MNTTILIIILATSSMNSNPAGVAMQEFSSYSACMAAGNRASKLSGKAKYTCVKY